EQNAYVLLLYWWLLARRWWWLRAAAVGGGCYCRGGGGGYLLLLAMVATVVVYLKARLRMLEARLEMERNPEDHACALRSICASDGNGRGRRIWSVDHELVFKAMSKALEVTNLAYLDLTDKTRIVYAKNLRDSRAVVALAQHDENEEAGSSMVGPPLRV
ncbi:hypothetical protein Tco_1088674, partial [Tanacetum coccineum]